MTRRGFIARLLLAPFAASLAPRLSPDEVIYCDPAADFAAEGIAIDDSGEVLTMEMLDRIVAQLKAGEFNHHPIRPGSPLVIQ